jgi:hypothetical protein
MFKKRIYKNLTLRIPLQRFVYKTKIDKIRCFITIKVMKINYKILLSINKGYNAIDAVKKGEFANKIFKKRTVNLEEILMRNRQ